MRKNKKYSFEFKKKIVDLIMIDCISKHEIERKYNVSRKTQREWVAICKQEGIDGLKDKRDSRKELLRINENLRKENANLNEKIIFLIIEIDELLADNSVNKNSKRLVLE